MPSNWRYLCPYFLVLLLIGQVQGALKSSKLMVLFADGLRWDLVLDEELSGFREFFASGTRAQHLKPVFPSLCYPNFYSLMTGLYPESHGLIGNNIYDPIVGDYFKSSEDPGNTAGDHWWEGAEPIWITAEKQHKSSSLYYWSGCNRTIHGHRPQFCRSNGPLTLDRYMDALVHALERLQSGHTHFVGMYYGAIDILGHEHGPTSRQVKAEIARFDKVLTYILRDLSNRGLRDEVNVMIVSDHGITDISERRAVDLRQYVPRSYLKETLEAGAYVNVWPKDDVIEEVYNLLESAHPKMHAYLSQDIPESWHYKNSHRVAPITVVADPGWYIQTYDYGFFSYGVKKTKALGWHGYTNDHSDMWGVFAAVGPDIRENLTIDALSVVDLYQLMCQLLNIQPLPHNGTWGRISPLLRPQTRSHVPDNKLMYDTKLTAIYIEQNSGQAGGGVGPAGASLLLTTISAILVLLLLSRGST